MQNPANLTQVLTALKDQIRKETEELHAKEAAYQNGRTEIMNLKQEILGLERKLDESKNKLKDLERKMPQLKREIDQLKIEHQRNHLELMKNEREYADALKQTNTKTHQPVK